MLCALCQCALLRPGVVLAFDKTDEASQLLGESSSQLAEAFPIEKPAEDACRSDCATKSWYWLQSSFGVRPSFFASFLVDTRKKAQTALQEMYVKYELKGGWARNG